MPAPRRGGLAAAVAVLALLVAPALPGAAGGRVLAHAQLVASSPGAGEQLATAPTEIRLVFSEPLEAQVTSLDLAGPDGALLVDHGGTIDPADPFALVLGPPHLPALADGIYTVTWRTLSAADGHTADGTSAFAVGADATLPVSDGGMTHTQPAPLDVIGRWLTYIGLLAALGIAIGFRVVVRAPMPRSMARVVGIGLLVAGGASLVLAVTNGLEAGSVGDYLLGTRNGALQLARAVVALAGGVLLVLAPGFAPRLVAAVTGVAGIVLLALAGHAAALPGPVAVLVQVVHIGAAGVWAGGVVLLLAVLARRRLVVATGPAPSMRTLVPRFSALALVSIGLAGVTGVFTAWSQTGVLVDPTTEYGRTLLLKSTLAVGAVALGALNYLDGGRMRRWLDGMRSRLGVESALIAAVLLMTGALAATPPLEQPPGVAIAPVPDAFGASTPGMTMTLSPGRPGVNRVTVTTTDAMAMISGGLDLVVDRLDTGSSTRVPLRLAVDPSVVHEGMGERGANPAGSDTPIDWIADAVVLPPDSRWDTSVRAISVAGTELARQRFAFTMSADGVAEGRETSLVDPGTAAGVLLLLGGALGIGIGLGGGRLPRCEAAASRLALRAGGAVAIGLGIAIGIDRLARL
jgi:copper transport protein